MVDWLLRLAGACVFTYFVFVFAGKVEGQLFPVAGDINIERSERDGLATRIWGTFDIYRDNCSFVGLEWHLVGLNRNVVAQVVFEEGTKLREGGLQEFGPWLVEIAPDNLGNSYAIVFHQCPWRPWRTETRFFP